MTISQKTFNVLTILATGVLVTGYVSEGLWPWAILIIAFGLLWLFGQRQGWDWVASFVMISFVIAATCGIFMDMQTGWFLVSVVITISAWDMYYFIRRLEKAGQVEQALYLEQRHLKRQMIIAGLGFLLGSITLLVELKIKFGWMLFWIIVLILSLNQLFDLLNREGE